ncbi:MAG: CoA transferase [Myxococcota bacterium]|nr:CoA transferase [Myxococcota bacterium]
MAALDGLRILDMTQYEAGTSCTQALAWMGADVVKVESTTIGDPGRAVGTGTQYSAYFCNWNANKRSLALDLTKPEGHALLLRMLPNFDVFVENYGPGVVERLDLGYERLASLHPPLIYAQVKGFGSTGPYAEYKSYDMIAQAAAGAFSVTGFPDGPPICPGPTTGDSGTGTQLGMAILAAYIQRMRTGEGQRIEVSMQEAMTYFMRTRIALASDWGRQAVPRMGNGLGPPTNLYPCKPFGPNDWAYVIVVTARHWDSLCLAIERPDLITDPRFDTSLSRLENGDALYGEVAAWMAEHTKHEAMEHLGKAGVPCSAVLDTKDLYDDPHLEERGFVQTLEHPEHGKVRLLGWAPRMSGSAVPLERAPLLGEHTDEVLAAEVGASTEEVQKLREAGVIA